MTRYALIDEYSGFVWGVTDADDAIEACRQIDAKCGEYGRDYESIGCGRSLNGRTGYYVYVVPSDFDVTDGQNDAQIATVCAMPLEAKVITWTIRD